MYLAAINDELGWGKSVQGCQLGQSSWKRWTDAFRNTFRALGLRPAPWTSDFMRQMCPTNPPTIYPATRSDLRGWTKWTSRGAFSHTWVLNAPLVLGNQLLTSSSLFLTQKRSRAFSELRKATINFVLSVYPSVCPSAKKNSVYACFTWNLICVFFENLSRKFKYH